jgi:transcriptional regulator with XRE-family HTH domain
MSYAQVFPSLGLAFPPYICVQCISVDSAAQRSLGAAVRRARKEAGLTQDQLGELADLEQAKISKYENGQHEPPLSAILRIDDALQQPRGYVLRLAQLIYEPDTGEQVIASDARLEPEHSRALLSLYKLAVDSRRSDEVEAVDTVSRELASAGSRQRRRRGQTAS